MEEDLRVLIEADVQIGQAIGSAIDNIINWFLDKIKWVTNKVGAIVKKVGSTIAKQFSGNPSAVLDHDFYIVIGGKKKLGARKGTNARQGANGVRAKLQHLTNEAKKRGREAIGVAKAGMFAAKLMKKKKARDKKKVKDINEKRTNVINIIKNIGVITSTIVSLITLYNMFILVK